MRIGLLSDPHGSIPATQAALAALQAAGAEQVVCLGDFCSEGVLDQLAGLEPPALVIPGNCDDPGDRAYAEALGLRWLEAPALLPLPEGVLALVHGHEAWDGVALLAQGVRWLAHGHTHRRADRRLGDLRLLCPGSCAQPRDGQPPACAVFDSRTQGLTWFDIG